MAPGQNAYTRSYSYDRIGNITYKSDVGSYAYTYNNQPHAVRTAGAVSLQYDLAGNMTQKVSNGVTLGITWNADNRPTLITRNGSDYIQYTYDGNGTRVRKVNLATGFVTRYYGEVYEERGTTGVIHPFASTTRIASVRTDGTIQYYHGNHLGSASVITDGTGTVKETIEYLPFGSYRIRQDLDGSFPNVNYTFTDQEDDDETGFYNYRARLYDPLLGRFISADSIVPEPGNLQAFNRYSYCVNNPLVYTDPSGHWFGLDDLVAAVVGAVVGGVSAAISGENILEGAAIGAAAGWVGWNTGFMASQQLTSVIEGSLGYCSAGTIAAGELGGAVLGGAAGGMVAGGMGAGFNGGNIGQGMLTGMYYGAATGAVMGGITSLYGYAKGLPTSYGVSLSGKIMNSQSGMYDIIPASDRGVAKPYSGYRCPSGIWSGGGVTVGGELFTVGKSTGIYRVACWDAPIVAWVQVESVGTGLGLWGGISGESIWVRGAYNAGDLAGRTGAFVGTGGAGYIGSGGSYSGFTLSPNVSGSVSKSISFGGGVGGGAGYYVGRAETSVLGVSWVY